MSIEQGSNNDVLQSAELQNEFNNILTEKPEQVASNIDSNKVDDLKAMFQAEMKGDETQVAEGFAMKKGRIMQEGDVVIPGTPLGDRLNREAQNKRISDLDDQVNMLKNQKHKSKDLNGGISIDGESIGG